MRETAKSAQNFAWTTDYEIVFGEVFSNVALRLVSRNPFSGTGFPLVNDPNDDGGREAARTTWVECLICCTDDTAHSQEWLCY
jgi:hypothetical protein